VIEPPKVRTGSYGFARCSLRDALSAPAVAGKLTPPEARTHTDNHMKYPGEVWLITHSAGQGDLGQGCSGIPHELLTEHNATFHDISHRRLAKALAESAEEVALTQSHDTSEINRSDV
jgi:hypothetical protein